MTNPVASFLKEMADFMKSLRWMSPQCVVIPDRRTLLKTLRFVLKGLWVQLEEIPAS